MNKIYVLDTSVLASDPSAFKSFDGDVVIPITVLEELDKLKKQSNEVGRNARVAIKLLDELSDLGDIGTGIQLEGGSLVKIDTFNYPNEFGDSLYGDTRILACADHYYKENLDLDVVLVSNDINLRVRAKSIGMEASSYDKEEKDSADLYEGCQVLIDPEAGIDLLEDGDIDPTLYELDLNPNECVIFLDEEENEVALGRAVKTNKLKFIKRQYPWELSPRNLEQALAIDMLMDPNLPFVSLIGGAGSGKTLLTLACALELVLNKKMYNKLVVYRPVVSVDEGIGFLPGSLEEKLEPWMQPIMDNLEVLMSDGGDRWKATIEMYKKKDKIEFSALSYIRGRSIPNALILIDEAQNISKEQIKTILTRAGEGSKIVLTGDIEQIDSRGLDAINNGLSYAVDKFKESALSGHITLKTSERSELASEAIKLL